LGAENAISPDKNDPRGGYWSPDATRLLNNSGGCSDGIGMKVLPFAMAAACGLLAGCASLPPLDSSELMTRMAEAHAGMRSFEDRGTVHDVEVDGGETNVSRISFHVIFVRDNVFQVSLRSERQHHAGSYSMIFHWDGKKWSQYNSLSLQHGFNPVETSEDGSGVIGSGIALSYGLMPFTARLLGINEDFRGFHGLDKGQLFIGNDPQVKTAQAAIDRLHDRPVYRLTLRATVAGFDDLENYWIDPRSYAILKREDRYIKPPGLFSPVIRKSLHSPRINTLPEDTIVPFKPPETVLHLRTK
jgi:hypothetical protein